MTPMQQMLLGVGAKKKTYMEDVFSTYLYTGNDSSYRNINNGIDLAGEGGMVWVRPRNNTIGINVFDTARGAAKRLHTDANYAESTDTSRLDQFNSNGFRVNGNYSTNGPSSNNYASWTFRKATGFFDVVTYTGNDTAGRQIAHSLGCVPGMIMVKCTTAAGSGKDWFVYHRNSKADDPGTDAPAQNLYLKLNENNAAGDSNTIFNDTLPTSTHFSVGSSTGVNGSGETYVAYLFAGGESNASEARSVDFTAGSGNYLQVQSTSTDLEMGSSDFTFELWLNSDGVTSANRSFFSLGSPVQMQHNVTGNMLGFFIQDDTSNWFINNVQSPSITDGAWNHVAITRSGNTWRFFLNGTQFYIGTHNVTVGGLGGNYPSIGSHNSGSNAYGFNGKISNVRFVKGTAVYTSSFRPPTEPLTNITNTKLLCCNNSSVTGSTVSPGTLASNGPTASTDSPFDDPAGFKFGDAGDQNIIKCGSYKGNSSADGPEINLGFEPQWFMIKRTDSGDEWVIYDLMRGIVTDGNDSRLYVNQTASETQGLDYFNLTSTGLKITRSSGEVNNSSGTYMYMALRRPDGYVGKPAEAGTDVFAMDAGNSSTTQAFTSGFPVDFALDKKTSATSNWEVTGRLIQEKYLLANSTNAEATYDKFTFDDMTGWNTHDGYDSVWQSWMWKRHAGFDVVTANNLPIGATLAHSLGKTPEMIIGKNRNNTFVWGVYHKGLNGGTNPEQYRLRLNQDDAEQDVTEAWNDTAPTATHFTVGVNHTGNSGGADYKPIFFLFASVDGISKVGSYTGNGTSGSSTQTISLGFQPRFLIIKKADGTNHWVVFDTVRGWNGSDYVLELNESGAQTNGYGNVIDPTSTGFTVRNNYGMINTNNSNYIYYAHS